MQGPPADWRLTLTPPNRGSVHPQAEFPDDPIILMGDFNMELREVQETMGGWPVVMPLGDMDQALPTEDGLGVPGGGSSTHNCQMCKSN